MSREYRRISYAVWEITLKCNLACNHCGSRAGLARHQELSTQEALDLVQQLAEVGIEEVTLIGEKHFCVLIGWKLPKLSLKQVCFAV